MKPRIKHDHSPWDLGWQAYENGQDISRNPFSSKTSEYKEWQEGYSSSMEEDQYWGERDLDDREDE